MSGLNINNLFFKNREQVDFIFAIIKLCLSSSLFNYIKIVAVNYSPFEKPIHAAVDNNIIKTNLLSP